MKAARKFRAHKREKSSCQGKKSEQKAQKRCLEEEFVDTPCKSNITLLLKYISSKIIHFDVVVNK